MARDKDSKAITITLPAALDRALDVLAKRNHCGNKSAAIRAVLYKEAGVSSDKIRLFEAVDKDEIAAAERRAIKYGGRQPRKKKK